MAGQTKTKGAGKRKPPLGKWLRRDCANLERHLVARKFVTPEQLDRDRPARSASNETWVLWYAQLRVWVSDEAESPGRKGEAEERMLAALREEPVTVRLLSGDEVRVYPKGLDALLWLRARGWLVEWLTARHEALKAALDSGNTDGITEPVSTLELLQRELAYQLGACCAVATTKGPGLGEYGEQDAELPDMWRDAHPIDLYRVNAAFQEVNAGRLEALQAIVKPRRKGEEGGRMSWNVFMGTLAMRLGEDPAELAKNRSLVNLLATVRLAAESEPEVAA